MNRSGLTLGLAFLATGFLLGCEGSGSKLLSSDVPDPQFAKPDCSVDPSHPSCKDDDGGGGGSNERTVELSGGHTTDAAQGPIELKETGQEVRISTPFNEKNVADEFIEYAINVDTDDGDGTTPANAIPLSGEMTFDETVCRWSGEIADAADAAAFWDDFLRTHAVDPTTDARFASWSDGRRFGTTIFKKDDAGKTGGRWWTWSGPDRTLDKQMWHLRVGPDDELGVSSTGAWDPATEIATVEGGSITVGWSDCTDDSDRDGCAPSAGHKAVACVNGAAFNHSAGVTFITDVQ